MFGTRPQQAERSAPDSLTTILPTPALRRDLAVQLLLLTDSLKQDTLSLFTPPPDPSTDAASTAIQDLISLDDAPPRAALPSGEDVASPYYQERARRRRANRAAELADARALGLKRAALTHFEAWRARLLRRACEALGTTAEAVKQGRRDHAARKMRDAEERERRALLDWAVGGEAAAPSMEDELDRVASLAGLDGGKRAAVLECCLLLVLSLEAYSAHSRVLLVRLAQALNLDAGSLLDMENQTAKTLVQSAANANVNADSFTQEQAASNAAARRWKVGIATVAGAALIGVTGGLAAPLLAAGIGTVTGVLGLGAVSGLLGAVAGSSVLIGSIFGAFGGRMTGRMVDELAKDVEDFKFIPLKDGHALDQATHPQNLSTPRPAADTTNKLRVAIGIHGPLTSERDILHPAYLLSSAGASPFALRWEVAALTRLGLSLTTLLRSYVWDVAKFEILRRTLLGALAAGLWPLGLLRAARVVDNPFAVARARADKAGVVLARALIGRCAGDRPVSLVGWSLGARVVWACLQELARQNAFGIVESAVLVGAPVPGDSSAWTRARAVVVGRLVNAYSTNDVILGLLYRANSGQISVAGLQAVEDVHRVENFDATDLLDGHTKYRYITGEILEKLGFEDLDPHGVMRERKARETLAAREKKSVKKEVDPEKEAAMLEKKVNAAVRERIGRGAKVDMLVMDVDDEEELRKKVELLKVAEDRKTLPTPTMAQKPDIESTIDAEPRPDLPRRPSSNKKVSPLFDTHCTVDDPLSQPLDDPLSETVVDPVLIAAVEPERSIANVESTVKVKEISHKIASDSDDELGDMTYLDPEPVPDSEDEY
jgi:hypothetical protein